MALTYPNSLASRGIDAAESTLGGNAVGSAPPSTELVMQLVARINELEHRLYVVEDQIKQKGDTHE